MKKKYISILLFVLLISGLVFAGCEKKEADNQQITTDSTEQGLNESEDNKKAPGEDSETTDEKENTQNQPGQIEQPDDSESIKKYEDFLDGKEKTGVSRVNLESYMSDASEAVVDKSKKYTIDELLKCLFDDRLKIYENSYKVEGLEYAYVDLGQDGERELVLHFKSYPSNDEYSNIMVIKNIDGQLELCFFTENGYRSYNYVNQNGVIASGGSGGASMWYDKYQTIDSKGQVSLIYDSETCDANSVYVDGEYYGDVAEKLGVLEDILLTRYSFENYNDREYTEESYWNYIKNSYYTYEKYDSDWKLIHPKEIYEPASNYYKFVALISNNAKTYDEMQEILKKRLEQFGLTSKMLEDNEPEWIQWEGHEDLFASTVVPAKYIVVENPSWEYYSTEFPYEVNENDFVTLSELSHKTNEIIDEADWFNEIGVEMPVNGEIQDPSYNYKYTLSSQYGEYSHEFDTITIHNNYTGRDEAILDFSNYSFPDEYAQRDKLFVRECVNYIQIVGSVAYVSISHRTYASSASHNAYIIALDMEKDFKVIWKSEPLVCNSANFAIVDGSIICGYGFTNEPDYIYELNRYTGKKMETIKVKTGPDYFYAIDGKLYVRTYDTNYVFQISWG